MENNPYAAPQASVLEPAALPILPDWPAGRLRLLGALALIALFGALVMLAMVLFGKALGEEGRHLAEWLGLSLMLLDSYLLLCLKGFAEARFAAQGLGWPVWLAVCAGVWLELLDFHFGGGLSSARTVQGYAYLGLIVINGLAIFWLGLRLRRVTGVYPAFRLMAWLDIAGGLLMASVLLVLLALLPLLGSTLALARVFLLGAAEQRFSCPGSGPAPG